MSRHVAFISGPKSYYCQILFGVKLNLSACAQVGQLLHPVWILGVVHNHIALVQPAGERCL